MISVKNQNGSYVEPSFIYTGDGKEIAEVRNNEGRVIFKKWSEIQGSLPLSFTSSSDYLKNYRIYGNTIDGQGVGQLDSQTNIYKIVVNLNSAAIFNPSTSSLNIGYLNEYGNIINNDNYYTYDYAEVNSRKVTLSFMTAQYYGTRLSILNAYDENKTIISQPVYEIFDSNGQRIEKRYDVELPTGTKYVRFTVAKYGSAIHSSDTAISLKELLSYNIEIGDSALQTNEYMDYRKQKIYKMINGVLTPTIPSTPIPQIETFSGENTISTTSEVQPSNVLIQGNVSEISS